MTTETFTPEFLNLCIPAIEDPGTIYELWFSTPENSTPNPCLPDGALDGLVMVLHCSGLLLQCRVVYGSVSGCHSPEPILTPCCCKIASLV